MPDDGPRSMKLFWSSRSPYVRQVMIAAHEKGLAQNLALIPTTVAMAAPNDQVMAYNPLNKIPTLVLASGETLYDSRVIIDHFDAIGEGPVLTPLEDDTRRVARRQQALGMGLLDLAVLWRSERMRPSAQQSQPLLDSFAKKLDRGLSALDDDAVQLANTALTIGHIALGTALSYLDFRFAEIDWRQSRPRARVLAHMLEQRAAFQATRLSDT